MKETKRKELVVYSANLIYLRKWEKILVYLIYHHGSIQADWEWPYMLILGVGDSSMHEYIIKIIIILHYSNFIL